MLPYLLWRRAFADFVLSSPVPCMTIVQYVVICITTCVFASVASAVSRLVVDRLPFPLFCCPLPDNQAGIRPVSPLHPWLSLDLLQRIVLCHFPVPIHEWQTSPRSLVHAEQGEDRIPVTFTLFLLLSCGASQLLHLGDTVCLVAGKGCHVWFVGMVHRGFCAAACRTDMHTDVLPLRDWCTAVRVCSRIPTHEGEKVRAPLSSFHSDHTFKRRLRLTRGTCCRTAGACGRWGSTALACQSKRLRIN